MFKPFHINASADDLSGNNGIGRYILLPGSNGRAKSIASHFDNLTVNKHPRGHHLYLGTITQDNHSIDVAAISTGMGCPSAEIILHELIHLGAKRFLRVGSAGSLQAAIKIGDIINVEGSVRDEDTTSHYASPDMPALASHEMVAAIKNAADRIGLTAKLHAGTVHCKSSFYAREFGAGPKADENNAYMESLTNAGVLATEMETSILFIMSQIYDAQFSKLGPGPTHRVICGAILGILAIPPHQFATAEQEAPLTKELTALAFATLHQLAISEK